MVRITCPVCGMEGHLQIRGSSARIDHYIRYRNGTRVVEWHRLDVQGLESVVNNGNHGNQSMVNEEITVF